MEQGEDIIKDDAFGLKALLVIESCNTVDQLVSAYNYLELFKKKFVVKKPMTERIVNMIIAVEQQYIQKRREFSHE